VKILLSPPRLPSYNGDEDSGVGSVKNHAFDHALATGDPCEWTLDDIYAAKLRCNETRRSDGRIPRELLEALVECGHLSFKRRRITPSIRKRNRARIS